MYYEEKTIGDTVWYRTTPSGPWYVKSYKGELYVPNN